MKNIFAFIVAALLLVGCDNNSPVEPTVSSTDIEFSETSMYKTAVATDEELVRLCADSVAHDSLRHGRMLGSLQWYVGLSDAQVESVKVYGKSLFEVLQNIRLQVKDSTITRDEARTLVQAARDQFVASVKSILTEDQITKFEEWIVKFWNKHHRRGHGRGGRGGDGGHGGRP
ncbi:MAG: hypothetical protein HYV29_14560 [Ignavibacteriales bacterium]|nr:hypothetical protein [Ignavibacteriales bacterium]